MLLLGRVLCRPAVNCVPTAAAHRCYSARMNAGGNRRLQGKRDQRLLSLGFDDQFKPRFNTGGGRTAADINVAPVFVSHSSGKLADRKRFAVNFGFYWA